MRRDRLLTPAFPASLRFDLVAQRSSLAVGNSRMTRRGCATLLRSGFDRHAGKACLLQLTTDQGSVVIAVGRACQKAGRIIRKDFRERVRHIVREHVLLDAIPYVEQETSAGLENPFRLAVTRLPIGEEHGAKLATNEIESSIFERQRQRICFAPADAVVGGLSRSGIVEHRLVEVGDDIAGIRRKPWRQRPSNHAAAGSGFQNGIRRKCRYALCNIRGEGLEDQRDQVAIVVFRDRAGEQLVGF